MNESQTLDRSQTFSVDRHPGGRSKGSIALDQWRGLALILVLISHGFFFTNRVNGAGRIGVNLFFFISGILVYRSLHKEGGRDKFHLATVFWWRRLRRLYPALIVYSVIMLGFTAILHWIPNLRPRNELASYLRAMVWALTYTNNYGPGPPIALQHLWSLACEMQFYTLAPIIFLLGGNSYRRRISVYGAATLILLALGLIYPLRMPHYETARYHFEVAVWPMMVGFFCEFSKDRLLRIPRRMVKNVFGIGVAGLVIAMIAMPFGMEMKKLVIALGAVLLAPCVLGYLFGLPFPGTIGRFLAWTGERTYSIYLWQQPFTICGFLPTALHPVGAVVSIFVGAASFHIFEKTFLSANRARQVSAKS